tara:strand:+ start:1338 stop:2414 length:1077 start_codon:yes stop_codon:yes gene_type:complete
MSNSFTSDPTLVDPGRLTASQTIRTTEIARLSDLANYCFATGGAYNVISQLYDDNSFCTNSNTFISMAEWRIPRISNLHNTLVINLQAFCPTAANATAEIDLDFGSVKYTTQISLTDEGRYNASFSSGTITATGVHADETAIVKLSLKAPTGQEVVLLGIQANWQALTSPLTTGELGQHNNTFTPQGQTRQGTDKPLSSRWGVEMLNNLNTLRRRPRVLFNWSGVHNTSSSSPINVRGAAPKAIGRGDLSSFYSEVALFAGTSEDDNLYLRVWTKLRNYSSGDLFLDVMGNTLTLNSSDWQSHDIEFTVDEVARSNQFGLSMYRAGLDDTRAQINTVSSTLKPPSANPHISGLCIIGV